MNGGSIRGWSMRALRTLANGYSADISFQSRLEDGFRNWDWVLVTSPYKDGAALAMAALQRLMVRLYDRRLNVHHWGPASFENFLHELEQDPEFYDKVGPLDRAGCQRVQRSSAPPAAQ